jgi:hypothetical protein
VVKVTIRFVDGSLHEFDEGSSFLKKLSELSAQAISGKELVNTLITDDWGAPPLYVKIKGESEAGDNIDITIPYR